MTGRINVPDLSERNYNVRTPDGGVAMIGVDLVADTEELRFGWHRRIWMVAPPTPDLAIAVSDGESEQLFVVENVEAQAARTVEEAIEYGTYTAFGHLIS